jgi:glycosyltransferase involved in cell wall biosynthesis
LIEISVIIPTLNEEKYIENCLISFKKQNFKDFEIIVSDGLSIDNTVKIAKKYADKVVSSKDKSIGDGRNKGAKIAKGKILLFVDADTIVKSDLLVKIKEVMKNKNVIGLTTKITSKEKLSSFDFIAFKIYNYFVRASLFLSFITPQIPGVCLCIKKSIFDKIGGFNVNMKTCEDLEFCERAKKYGKFLYLNDTFVKTSIRRMRNLGRLKFITHQFISLINYMLFKKGKINYGTVR